jgi:hypothetical protein
MECGARVYIWTWTNDQLSYESPHDTLGVAPFPLFQNLAAPKSPSNSMALSVHGILCGNTLHCQYFMCRMLLPLPERYVSEDLWELSGQLLSYD